MRRACCGGSTVRARDAVGHRDCGRLVLEGLHRDHRPEDLHANARGQRGHTPNTSSSRRAPLYTACVLRERLLLDHLVVLPQVGDHGRREEEAAAARRRAARDDACVRRRARDEALDALELRARGRSEGAAVWGAHWSAAGPLAEVVRTCAAELSGPTRTSASPIELAEPSLTTDVAWWGGRRRAEEKSRCAEAGVAAGLLRQQRDEALVRGLLDDHAGRRRAVLQGEAVGHPIL
jgi:hypothetical protein